MNKKIRILHLEDSLKDSELICSLIESGGIEHEYLLAEDKKDFLNLLETENIDLILSDYNLPDYNGDEALKAVKEKCSYIPFIFVSAVMGEDAAINSLLNGATDYVLKNKLERLVPAIKRAIHETEIEHARIQLEEELRLTSEIINNMEEGVHLVKTSDGTIAYANPKFDEMFGYAPGEMLGKHVSMVNAPTNRTPREISEEIKAALNKDKVWQGEVLNIRKDGTTFWCSAKVSTFEHEKYGTVWISTHNDITERKLAEEASLRAENALRESEERFRAIYDSVNDAVFVHDLATGTILNVNKRMCELYGYTREEASRISIGTLSSGVPPYTQQDAVRWIRKAVKEGPQIFEWHAKDKAGCLFWVEVNLRHATIVGEERILVTVRDITERKRAEEELEMEKGRLVRASNAGKIALWEWDLQTDGLDWSGTIDSMLGFGSNEFPRTLQAWEAIIHSEDKPLVMELLNRHLEEGIPYEADYRVQKVDGSYIWWHDVGVAQRDVQGKIFRMSGACVDITERKKAEEQLLISEQTYRGILDSISEAVYIQDENGYFLDVNLTAENMYGYKKEYFVGRTPEFLSAPGKNDFPKIAEAVKKAFNGEPQYFEFWGLRKDGTFFPKEVSLTSGKYFGRKVVIAIARDITERIRAKELQNAVYQISQAVDKVANLDDLYKLVHEIIGTIMPAENFYISLYDEEKDLINFPYFVDEVNTPFTPTKPGKGLTAYVLRTGKPLFLDEATDAELRRRGEVELIGAPSAIWIGVPLIVENKTVGVMVVQHYSNPDAYTHRELQMLEYISSQVAKSIEKKWAEEKLRQSEEQFRLISENVADMIAVLDLDGKRLYNSPSYKSILGDPGPLRGTDSFQEIHPEDRERIRQIFQETVRTGIGQRTEYRLLLKDGSIYYIESQGSVIRDGNGKITQLVFVSRDVTEKKKNEEQFLQTQKLESIGTLASGIAHDFNNILGIILGHSDLLKHVKENPDKISKSVDAITKATVRGASLVKQLLTFARKTDVIFESVSVNDVISDIVKLVQETFPKIIVISTEQQQDLPLITADSTQIHQVLLNLCINARDAMPNGGILSISTSTINGSSLSSRFTKPISRQYVKIKLSDTGVGIDEAIRQRIFEPFYTTKGIGKGTGLGLSLVYGIVENHNGFIDVVSELGKGTSFSVYLPVQEPIPETYEPPKKAAEALPGGKETILLIEDEEMLMKLLKDILVSKGYTVITAEDGEQGLEVFLRHQKEIAVVVSDIGLPKLGGDKVFKKIRAINPQAKVILASGFIDPKAKSELFKAGVKHIIQKPYSVVEVLQKIREVLDAHY